MELIPSDSAIGDEIIAQVYRSNLEELRDVHAMTKEPRAPVLDATKLDLVRTLVGGVLETLESRSPNGRKELIQAANLSYSATVLGIILYKDATASPKVPRPRAQAATR